MPHLNTFRKGWQSENLALYFLHQFAFVAKPFCVADDVGADYYCTLFDVDERNQLLPRSAFSIQIKSDTTDIDNNRSKVDYFNDLEMPFFIGVVNKAKGQMDVYSGGYIQHFASWIGNPLDPNHPSKYLGTESRVLFRPVAVQPTISNDHYFVEDEHHVIQFPLIGSVDFADKTSIARLSEVMKKLCTDIQRNNSLRKSGSYVLTTNTSQLWQVYTGPTSVETFRDNFNLRLAEAFANLHWLFARNRSLFQMKEYERFEHVYLLLKDNHLNSIAPSFTIANHMRSRLRQALRKEGLLPTEIG